MEYKHHILCVLKSLLLYHDIQFSFSPLFQLCFLEITEYPNNSLDATWSRRIVCSAIYFIILRWIARYDEDLITERKKILEINCFVTAFLFQSVPSYYIIQSTIKNPAFFLGSSDSRDSPWCYAVWWGRESSMSQRTLALELSHHVAHFMSLYHS